MGRNNGSGMPARGIPQEYDLSVDMRSLRLIPFITIALVSTAQPVCGQMTGISGVNLYQNALATTKLEENPEKTRYLPLDKQEALKISQSVIGKQLRDYTFTGQGGRKVRLSDYRGKPLVVDMIYTHCPLVCATKTRNLDALKLSREALGADSFRVLTIGFDTENDTPEAMNSFAKRINAKVDHWEFVSADAETIKNLSQDIGFVFAPSPNGGFDHITQTTFIDSNGKVYQQIYGDEFDNKTLLDPLKSMIYKIKTSEPGIAGFSNKIRLFCTIYDARTGRYNVDYSYFYGIGMGVLVSLFIIWWIIMEHRRSRLRHR